MSSSNFYSFSDDEDDDREISQQGGAGPSRVVGVPESQLAGPSSVIDSDSLGGMDFTPPRRRQTSVATSSPLNTRARAESVATTATYSVPQPLPAIVRLQKVWVAERACPDLLAWSAGDGGEGAHLRNLSSTRWRCDEIVDEVCAQIEQQVSILNLLTADETTSEEEHLRLSMVQLDVERARWLLRAYLRTRISKLESHSTHYSLLPPTHLEALLSPLERAYLTKYDSLRTSHLTNSVLSYLPESLQSLTDLSSPHEYPMDDPQHTGASKGSIIQRPDVHNAPVFIHCLEDCGGVRMDDGEEATLTQGSVHLVAFAKVRSLVSQGRVELI